MKNIYIALLLCIGISHNTFAQDILFGTVQNQDGEVLVGATVLWDNTTTGAITDLDGYFEIPKREKTAQLRIQYVGYNDVVIEVLPTENDLRIEISGITALSQIEVTGKQIDHGFSVLENRNIESIHSGELRKAACCNLGESFTTNLAVDVATTNAATGSQEIQMLGLRGIYTQMMIENRQALYGLAYPFALEYIPGTWIEAIQISKGTSTVRQGAQGLTGQINTEIIKPIEADPLYVNIYGNQFGRMEANVHLSKELSEKWSTGLLLHGNYLDSHHDWDNDKFHDMASRKQLNAMWRNFYRSEFWEGQFNVQGIVDRRSAGQLESVASPYRINQGSERLEFFGKMGYIGFENPNTSIGSIFSVTHQGLNGTFGESQYNGTQRSATGQILYSTILGTTDHNITGGVNVQLDDYKEDFQSVNFDRVDRWKGVYGEYTYSWEHLGENRPGLQKMALVLGGRVDHHNRYGWQAAPRMSLRANFSDRSVLRFSAGKGYRTANILAENFSQLASHRMVRVDGDLALESSWNVGGNFTQNFSVGTRAGTVNLDFYRTTFTSQVVMDVDKDYQSISFYNLEGRSYSNSLIVLGTLELGAGFNGKLGYKFNDVKTTYQDAGLDRMPLIPIHRGLIALDWETKDERWMANISSQIVGQQRLPNNSGIPSQYLENHPAVAPSYALINAQVTRSWKTFELYVGAENLANYRQYRPVIAYEDPFGPYFNAAQVYAPTRGLMVYSGLRWRIPHKEHE